MKRCLKCGGLMCILHDDMCNACWKAQIASERIETGVDVIDRALEKGVDPERVSMVKLKSANGKNGWTVDYTQLEEIKRISVEHISLEQVEAVLIAAMRLGFCEMDKE